MKSNCAFLVKEFPCGRTNYRYPAHFSSPRGRRVLTFSWLIPVFTILTLLRLYRSALDPFVSSLLQHSGRALAVPLSVYAGTRLPRGFVNWCPQLNILE